MNKSKKDTGDKKNDRYKDWLFLLWMDNYYPDFMRRLENSGVMAAVSPQHNNDTWEYGDDMFDDPRVGCDLDYGSANRGLNAGEIGKPKKPHRHIILRFPGNRSQDQVNDFVKEIFSESPCLPMRCWSVSGQTRYLVHYDQPHKERFSVQSIISLNGYDVLKYFKPTVIQEDELFYELRNIIESNDFQSFYSLMLFLSNSCQNGDYVEEFRYCRSHVHLISTYVRARASINERLIKGENDAQILKALNQISAALRTLSSADPDNNPLLSAQKS